MKNWIIILIIGVFVSCSPGKQSGHHGGESIHVNEQFYYFENATKIKTFGDSMRIEYEIYGDSIIQHVIDLKGIEGDGFDNSYTGTSIWATKEVSQISCDSELKIISDSLDFRFCMNDVIEYFDSLIIQAGPWKGESTDKLSFFNMKMLKLQKTKSQLEKIKRKKISELEIVPFNLPFNLLATLDCRVKHLKSNEDLNKVLVEKYTTDFSGGKNFHFLNQDDETVCSIHVNEYMK